MSVAGHHLPIWFDEATGPTAGQGVFWNAVTHRFEAAAVDISALDTAGLATDAAVTAGLATKQDTIPPGTYGETQVPGVPMVAADADDVLHGLDMRRKGVRADGVVNFTGSMTAGSPVITLATATARNSYSPGFDASLDVGVGKKVNVQGAGAAGAILAGTIVSVTDSTHATLSVPAVIDSRGPRTITGISSVYDAGSVPNSQVYTAGSGAVAASDRGRRITITGTNLGGAGVNTLTVIVLEILSATTFKGSKPAQATLSGLSGTITGAEVTWGTDDTAAIVAMMDSSITDFRHIGASALKWPPGIILISKSLHYFGGTQFLGSGSSYDLTQSFKGTVFKALSPWDSSRGDYMLDTDNPTFGGQVYSHGAKLCDFSLNGSDIAGLSGLRIWQGGEAVEWSRIHASRCPGAGIKLVGDFANLYAGPMSAFENGVGFDFEDAGGAVTLINPSGDDNTTFMRIKNYVNGATAAYSGVGLNLMVVSPKVENRVAGRCDPAILIDQLDGGSVTFFGGIANNQVVGWTAEDFVKIAALTTAINTPKVKFVPAAYTFGFTNVVNDVPATRKVPFLVAGTHPDINVNNALVMVNSQTFLTSGTSLQALFPNQVKRAILEFLTSDVIALRSASATGAGVKVTTSDDRTIMEMAKGNPETLDVEMFGALKLPGVRFRGAWAATTAYLTGDVVAQNGRLWLAPSGFTSGDTFRPASWVALGQQAPPWGVGTMVDPISARSSDVSTFAQTSQPSIFYRLAYAGSATKVRFRPVTASGNIEFTLHANTGTGDAAYPGAKIGGTGSFACPAAGDREQSFLVGELSWYAGDWLGIAADNTTATLRAVLSAGEASSLGAGRCWLSNVFPIQSNPGSVPGDLLAYSGKLLQVALR